MQVKKLLEKNHRIIRFFIKIYNNLIGIKKKKMDRNNKIEIGNALLYKICIQVKGKNNYIHIDSGARIKKCKIYISGNNNHIYIGKNCYLNEVELHMEKNNNEIHIKDNVVFYGNSLLAALEGKKIEIGEESLFSSNIVIRTGDSHIIYNQQRERINHPKDIIIGRHVWMGANIICLKGTEIANDCVVGAGSVLTKKYIDSHSCIAGNPAKIVKEDIEWRYE